MAKEGTKRKAKGKKKKDPNKPKRGMSSFMFFANEKRPSVRAQFPQMAVTDIGRKLGELWKTVDPAEKKRFEEQAQRDKERYVKAMESYHPPEASDSDSDPPKKKKGKKKATKKSKKDKDPNKPKRPTGSFMFFSNDKRAEVRAKNPDLKATEIGKKLSELWAQITADDKKKYEAQAQADKARYAEAMKSYTPPAQEESSSSSGSSSSDSDSGSSD